MKRILIAEDDPGIRDTVKIILESDEYDVELFSNGNLIINNHFTIPDLFILDKQLTGVDGLDICSFLKSQDSTKNIPVIMLSANPHILTLATKAGANDALEKPFRMKDLKALVAGYLQS